MKWDQFSQKVSSTKLNGTIIFFQIRGGHEKAWGHRIFSWEIGGSQKIKRYWMATNLNENFVKWNSPKMHIFCTTHIGGYMFLQHCSSGGGGGGIIKFLIIKWGGHKNIAEELSEIHDPPIPKKMVAPNSTQLSMLWKQWNTNKIMHNLKT